MKNLLKTAFVIVLCASSLTSCKPKLKKVTGVVANVEMSNLGDTLKSMKLVHDKDTMVFSLKEARYSNGEMMKSDSVDVHYVKGNGDTLRAMLVFVKPKPSKVIDIKADTTKELLTR